MAVSQMKRISLLGLLRDKEKIIEKLQKLGMVHISDYEEVCQINENVDETKDMTLVEESAFSGMTLADPETALRADPEYLRISDERAKLRRCIEELSPFDERKKSLFSFLLVNISRKRRAQWRRRRAAAW